MCVSLAAAERSLDFSLWINIFRLKREYYPKTV